MQEKTKAWLGAARPRTLLLAVASMLVGGALAIRFQAFEGLRFSLALLTAMSLQILSNFANDYGDYSHGVDNDERVGPTRALQSGVINKKEMFKAILISAIFAFLSGISLIALSFNGTELLYILLFAVLGLGAIWAAIKYTAGKNPYGYAGLGDFFVFVFFGLVAVLGMFYLFTKSINVPAVLLAVAMGCFSTAVLNVNNMRDIVNDAVMGKTTIPVRLGLKGAKIYHFVLLFVGWFCLIWFTFIVDKSVALAIAAPLFLAHMSTVVRKEGKELDPELKRLSIATLLTAVLILIDVIR